MKSEGRDQTRICPKCGQANDSQSAFCMECGTPLGDVAKADASKKPVKKGRKSRALVLSLLAVVAVVILAAAVIAVLLVGRGGNDTGGGGGNGGGSIPQGSSLSATLNDVYFMDFPSWGECGLYVDVTLKNTGSETIYIQGYFMDSHGTTYAGSFDTVGMGSTYMSPGYVMSNTVYGALGVPKDATGLKFIIATSKGRTTVSLPNASSIRVE